MTALGRATIIAGFLAAVAIANAAVPTGGFIRRPVKSVGDLIAHTKSDPVVMERFTRHFRMTPDQVTSYSKTLHLAKIAKDGVYLVYNVRPDNIIRGRHFSKQFELRQILPFAFFAFALFLDLGGVEALGAELLDGFRLGGGGDDAVGLLAFGIKCGILEIGHGIGLRSDFGV